MISKEVLDDHTFGDVDFWRREEMIKRSLDSLSWRYSTVCGSTTDCCVEDGKKRRVTNLSHNFKIQKYDKRRSKRIKR